MGFVIPIHERSSPVPMGRMESLDLDVLRLVLNGGSVIDWFRLHFSSDEAIDTFVRVNEFRLDDPVDRARIAEIRQKAVDYLQRRLRYRILSEIGECADVRRLFAYASGRGRRTERLQACLVLKVMDIIHYVDAHELRSMLPISDTELGILMRAKIERAVRGLLERGFPVNEFSGNAKRYDSIISKLLAKKDTHNARLFDLLRFRLVVERSEDIPPLLLALTRELIPFNYVVPSQADNSLIDLDRILVRAGNGAAIRALKEENAQLNEQAIQLPDAGQNQLSGPDYRVVNFVADIPLRIDGIFPSSEARRGGLGHLVFVTVEFQVVDRVTAENNETGENRHARYKLRQRRLVRERLERGKRKKVLPPESEGGDA
jgi:uncharacterized protein (TIGR04552 family)